MLHHIAIGTNDPVGLAAFYDRLPGLHRLRTCMDTEGLVRSVWYRIDPGPTILMLEKSDPPQAPRAMVLRAAMLPEGCTADGLPGPIVRRTPYTVYLLDPDGNTLGFSTYPDPLPPHLHPGQAAPYDPAGA